MAGLNEIREARLKKIEILKEAGMDPYPISSFRTHMLTEITESFILLEKQGESVVAVGRVMAIRGQGAVMFIDVDDGTAIFQSVIKKDEIGDKQHSLFQDTVDMGDFVEISGTLFTTQKGQPSLLAKEWRMLSKSLRPLPEKRAGLQDPEERYRRRYLDLLTNKEVRERFVARSKLVSILRRTLDESGFIEVETPMLQEQAGGAIAKPFVTHHNALDIDLFLRIAPELYLKELLVGGLNKVYEIGRLFRNEGIDVTHNPEFTTIELYESYKNASEHMVFLESLIKALVENVTGSHKVSFQGDEIDFLPKFTTIAYLDLFKKYAELNDPWSLSLSDLREAVEKRGVVVADSDPKERILDNLYKKLCRPKLIQPTYIVDYPLEFSPLAKEKADTPGFIDRYQLVVGGLEIVNAFSELNDPLVQKDRFVSQEENKNKGDEEAHVKDEDYVEAMEYGMPPAAGLAISIDRMTMILTDTHNIREVILFPTMRPR